jgi:hypothetical protein
MLMRLKELFEERKSHDQAPCASFLLVYDLYNTPIVSGDRSFTLYLLSF